MSNVIYLPTTAGSSLGHADPAWHEAVNCLVATAALLSAKANQLKTQLRIVDRIIETVEDPVLQRTMQEEAIGGRLALDQALGELLTNVGNLRRIEG